MRHIYPFTLPVLLLFFAGCAALRVPDDPVADVDKSKQFVIWAHSDIQPRGTEYFQHYEDAISDIRENIPGVDLAIVAGDQIEGSGPLPHDDVYDWIDELRTTVDIPQWLVIAGNHEWQNIDAYYERFGTQLHYSASFGNILILLMSNEARGRQTVISDETFAWWKQQVIDNQDKIIITVTHARLKESGLFATSSERTLIVDSERFADVLREYRVDMWISGHTHIPGWLPRTHRTRESMNGILFIDLGSIRKESIYTRVESRLLYFTEGSSEATICYRNHEKRKRTKCITFELSQEFERLSENTE